MADVTQKYFCNKCGTNRSIEYFAIDRSRKRGHASTCKFCKRKYSKKIYSSRKTSIDMRFSSLVHTTKKKNLELSITKDQYEKIIKNKNCHYCDIPLDTQRGYCLDRKDNNLGYILNNVLPCCARCNMSRQDNFTTEEWFIAMQALKKWGEGRT